MLSCNTFTVVAASAGAARASRVSEGAATSRSRERMPSTKADPDTRPQLPARELHDGDRPVDFRLVLGEERVRLLDRRPFPRVVLAGERGGRRGVALLASLDSHARVPDQDAVPVGVGRGAAPPPGGAPRGGWGCRPAAPGPRWWSAAGDGRGACRRSRHLRGTARSP